MTSKILAEKMRNEIDKIKAERMKNEAASQATVKQKRNAKRDKNKAS